MPTGTLADLIQDLTAAETPEFAPAEPETDDWFDLLSSSPDLVIGAEFDPGFEPVIPSSEFNSEVDLSSIDLALSDPTDLTLADFTADLFAPAGSSSLESAEPIQAAPPPELPPELPLEPLSESLTATGIEAAESFEISEVIETFEITETFEIPETLETLEATEPVENPEEPESTELDADTFAQLDLLLAEPPAIQPPIQLPSRPAQWTLGLDLGTTGLSAVLLDQTTHQLYPLYWQDANAQKQFRRSTTVTAQQPNASPTASPLDTLRSSADSTLTLSDWKPYLQLAIPHHSPQTSQWEPVLQWSDSQALSLRTLQEVLQQLLLSLTQPDALTCRALGLEAEAFQSILASLASVVVSYSGSASETYSFNLREAILQAGLVSQPDQILFVEEAIAALLSALPAANGEQLRLSHQASEGSQSGSQSGSQGHLHNADWQGCTLVLTAGASLSELLLVQLPAQLPALNHTDFYLRGLPYAGAGLDQDIICQLLYPMLAVPSEADEADSPPNLQSDFETDLTIPADLLADLFAGLSLPAAADPALAIRSQLRQRLTDSAAGHQLLTAARTLKITLQYQPHCHLRFGDRWLSFERTDLTSRILLPYVQRLNRELTALLAQTNNTAAAVKQVICTGGTASLNAITRWLRQKLPNATIIQDTYARSNAASFDHGISSCSRTAYGLATLPLHPQVINLSRHCYSDYFLLKALLQVSFPQPLAFDAILAALAQQGIDTALCRLRILALLEGALPPGLMPSPADLARLTANSAANPDYQAIRLAPLFHKSPERHYSPNRAQSDYLQRYLETLLADAEQTLTHPLRLLQASSLAPN